MKYRPKGVCWFSAGVTSAVATKVVLERCKDQADIDIIFFETGNHHPDDARFIADCEKWYGQEIEIHKNEKYEDAFDVLRKMKYINGPDGAPCTLHMKKNVRFDLEKTRHWDFQVFGFEFQKAEINRAIRFTEQYGYAKAVSPLIEARINKSKALSLLKSEGIEIPAMYKLGYSNNNCIGCVKGGMGYWNKVRKDFPEVFEKVSELEQYVGASCLKEKSGKLFLKDLDPNRGHNLKPITAECGVVCAVEFQDLISPNVARVLKGDLSVLPTLDLFLNPQNEETFL